MSTIEKAVINSTQAASYTPLDLTHIENIRKNMNRLKCDKCDILASARFSTEAAYSVDEEKQVELLSFIRQLHIDASAFEHSADISYTHPTLNNHIFISAVKRGKSVDVLIYQLYSARDLDIYT